ncbi:MAG TPA: maleylpyruvate isomerase N-terminal domain-containing protein, partial [Roseiflexaceae bacterium]|nr:maleylpyruvate isomerase N-terminal domain-containing protein [Roseiflexaceae bacterium]
MNEQQEPVAALRAEFERWQAMLSNLSEAQVSDPQLAEGWSIKDVVAHLWQWQQRSVARVEAALQDREPDYPAWPELLDPEEEGEPHELNAWLYAQAHDLPWSNVYQSWS